MFSASLSFSSSRPSTVVCRGFKVGDKVKVTSPITMYHVPKNKQGIALEGMTGEVVEDVTTYKGQELSATQPFVVAFEIPNEGGKPTKFKGHFEESEIALAEITDPIEDFCAEEGNASEFECKVYED